MITQDYLKSVLSYDPETGIFTWAVDKGNNAQAGSLAGTEYKGYLLIHIDGKRYRAHNLAALYMTGTYTTNNDHKDCDGLNNAWSNIRPSDKFENAANHRKRKDNSTGYKGVAKHGRRYRAYINHKGVRTNLGTYDTPEEAYAEYCKAAERLHGDFANLG